MNDDQLDDLIREAGPRFRAVPPLDTASLWERIDAHRRLPSIATTRGWRVRALLGIAAALVVGVAIGRFTAGGGTLSGTDGNAGLASGTTAAVVTPRGLSQPVERTASALLGETAALLSAIPASDRGGAEDRRFGRLAQELLVTTRLLLDDGVSADPRLRELLGDLELILSQVARLQHHSSQTELELINEALQERELVPRIRRAAASLAASD